MNSIVNRTAFIAGPMVAALAVSPCLAATIFVTPTGSNYNDGLSWATAKATIHAAVYTAADGDSVWVAAGVYEQRVTIDHEVALYGGFAGDENPATFQLSDRDFDLHPTMLDGDGQWDEIIEVTDSAGEPRIDGFTVQGGPGCTGISCSGSSPMITNNLIRYNGRSGIRTFGGSPQIVGNVIRGNIAASGGGVYCIEGSPRIKDNLITTNLAGESGGGIYCFGALATICGNEVTDNEMLNFEEENPLLGGGILCAEGEVIIENNQITGNTMAGYLTAFARGGGIYCGAHPATIRGNIISNNSVSIQAPDDAVVVAGGGIYCNSRSSATIEMNDIAENTIAAGDGETMGAGICCAAATVINGNNILNNVAENWTRGGGIYAAGGVADITNNVLIGNTFIEGGEGVGIYTGSASSVVGNTVRAQHVGESWAIYVAAIHGSGLAANNFVANNPGLGISQCNRVVNNTVVGNGSNAINGNGQLLANNIVAFNKRGVRSLSRHVNNCVFGNEEYQYYPPHPDPTGTDGNISADPGFILSPDAGPDALWGTNDDELGDLHLSAASPCIDTGSNGKLPAGMSSDLDGAPRLIDGDCDSWPMVDMGAFEYQADCGDNLASLVSFEDCFEGPGLTPAPPAPITDVDCLDSFDLNADGDVDLADFASFQASS